MINGVVVGLVTDNQDPDGMHRVKVDFPVQGEGISSTWARVVTPMAGADRGLVLLPEVGSEVLLGFAFRSLNAYVLGALYNGGDDTPDPYDNSDGDNFLRLIWTRGDNQLCFDDTSGSEKVGIGAKAGTAGDVTSAPVYDEADASAKTITHYADQDITWEAAQTISITCVDFSLSASASVTIEDGSGGDYVASAMCSIDGGGMLTADASSISIGSGSGSAGSALSVIEPSHPPA